MLNLLLGKNVLQSRHRHPRLHASTTPACIDNTDRDIHSLRKVIGKEVCRSRHICHALRRCAEPLATLAILLLLIVRASTLHGEHTDSVSLLSSRENVIHRVLHGLATKALDGHLHITLARAHPHVADKDIIQLKSLAIADSNGLRLERCGGSINLYRPTSLAIGRGLYLAKFIPRYGDGNLRVRRSLTPQISHTILLEHHIATQHLRQFNLRRCPH